MEKIFGKGEDVKEKEETETEEPKSIEERIEHLMDQKKEAIRETILDDINHQLEGRFKAEIDELKTLVTWTEPIIGEDLLRIVEKGGSIFRDMLNGADFEHYGEIRIDDAISNFISRRYDRGGKRLNRDNKYRVTIIIEPL